MRKQLKWWAWPRTCPRAERSPPRPHAHAAEGAWFAVNAMPEEPAAASADAADDAEWTAEAAGEKTTLGFSAFPPAPHPPVQRRFSRAQRCLSRDVIDVIDIIQGRGVDRVRHGSGRLVWGSGSVMDYIDETGTPCVGIHWRMHGGGRSVLVLVNQSRRLSQPPCRWCRRDERRSRNRIPAQNHCGRPHLNAISYSSNVNISKMRRTTNAPSHRPLFSPSPTDEATGIFPEPAAPAAADAEEAAEEAEASEEPGGSLDVAEQAAQAAEQMVSLEAGAYTRSLFSST